MEKSINNFKYHDIENNKEFKKMIEEKRTSMAWKEVNESYYSYGTQTFFFFVILVGTAIMHPTGQAAAEAKFWIMLSAFIWFVSMITLKMRKKRAFSKEIKQNNIVISNIDILNTFLEKKGNLRKLGKTFYIKHNEITNSIKREYFGDVLIYFTEDKNEIYILNKKELYEKIFYISDIVSFKQVSDEGLGEVKSEINYDADIDNMIYSDNRANRLRAETKISSITRRTSGLNNLHDNIRASQAMIDAQRERDNLNNKIKQEEKRLRDELDIRLLEFSDGDYLLISHLNDNILRDLEQRIEGQ